MAEDNAPETWTTPQQVQGRWTADEYPEDEQKILVKIGQAERAIRREFPTMAARLAARDEQGRLLEPDLKESVADVVTDLVQENLTNPYGLRQIQSTEGPWTEQQTIAGDSPGKMVLSAQHKRLLAPPSSGSRMKTIDLEAGSLAAGGGRLSRNAAGIVVTPEGWPV